MPPHTPHTFLYNTIIVKYKQVYSHVNSPHIFTAVDMLLAHIRTVVLFYLHRRHGWFTPASVYSQSALRCSLLISGHWRYFTYIVDTAGFSSLRIFAIRTYVLLAHIRTVVLFYLHRRHGWFTPASVYSQSALRCSLLISGHSSKRKPVVHTSVTTGFFFPHCLRLHHAHSSAGTGWHCWSVLFDCSYC